MIFKHDDPIDDNVIELAKRLKKLVKKGLSARWQADKDVWIFTCEKYVSSTCLIKYNWIEKKKYESLVYWPGEGETSIGVFETPKEVVDSIALFRFMEEGISDDVIAFIATKLKTMEMKEAVNLVAKDEKVTINVDDMRILGIDSVLKGAVASKRFGV